MNIKTRQVTYQATINTQHEAVKELVFTEVIFTIILN